MSGWGKYLWAALIVAALAHVAVVHATPRIIMGVALERLSDGRYNSWRLAERITPESREIVRPSPDFAYSACPYDLSRGPVLIRVAPWSAYWSLSLYADNTDNYFVLNDREARQGGEIMLIRSGARPPESGARVVESPSARGIAIIRRIAPRAQDYAAAAAVARADLCTTLEALAASS